MNLRHARRGFTLTELMIVIAVIAVISGVALPKLLGAKLTANESAAISTLRALASAQAQLTATGMIDSDADGAGEYAYLGELSGLSPTRISVAGAPALGGVGDELDPSVVSVAFGNIQTDGIGEGVVTRSGYVFKMFLPGATALGITPAVAEAPVGGADPGAFPDPNNSEILWSCYAWPADTDRSGNRVFFINQEGELLAYDNRAGTYSGLVTPATIPSFDAALSNITGGGDMAAPLATGAAGVTNDGNTWVPVQ